MTMQDDLNDKLWDYVYGLLDADEARAVETQITSDHDVARAYAEVRQLADKLAAAARCDIAPITLVRPAEPVRHCALPASRTASSKSYAIAQWVVGLAVLLLVAVAGYGWQQGQQLRDPQMLHSAQRHLLENQVRLVVSGPAQLPAGSTHLVTVLATDLEGAPRAVPLAYRYQHAAASDTTESRTTTDHFGRAQIELAGLPPGDQGTLALWCEFDGDTSPVTTHFHGAAPIVETFLESDKRVYRPGEVVQIRSLTLAGTTTPRPSDTVVEYSICDLDGTPLPGTRVTGLTELGVGNGAIALDGKLAAGTFLLNCYSPNREFPTRQLPINVASAGADRPLPPVALTLSKRTLQRGEEAAVKLDYDTAGAATELKLAADLGGRQLSLERTLDESLQRSGTSMRFRVPADVRDGVNKLNVQVEQNGQTQTLSTDVVVSKPRVQVEFYPEGGQLVPNLTNYVYFFAHNGAGTPVPLNGQLVDAAANPVANLQAGVEGRGRFSVTPSPDATYRVKLAEPAVATLDDGALVAESKRRSLLSAPSSVIQAGKPLTVNVSTTDSEAQLLVAANWRGMVAGQQMVNFADDVAADKANATLSQAVQVPLHDGAAGMIGVTLYDYQQDPPALLAERWVYRQPVNHWNIALRPQTGTGDANARWDVQVTDESGRPGAAVLGARVVADDFITTGVTSHSDFAVFSERVPADAYFLNWGTAPTTSLGFDPVKLDLFLGTSDAEQVALAEVDKLNQTKNWALGVPLARYGNETTNLPLAAITLADNQTTVDGPLAETRLNRSPVSAMAAVRPPVVVDNLPVVAASYEQALGKWRSAQEENIHRWGQALCLGSGLILLLLAVMGALKLAGSPAFWLPAAAAAAATFVLGGVWQGLHISPPNLKLAQAWKTPSSVEVATLAAERAPLGMTLGKGAELEKLNESDLAQRTYTFNAPAIPPGQTSGNDHLQRGVNRPEQLTGGSPGAGGVEAFGAQWNDLTTWRWSEPSDRARRFWIRPPLRAPETLDDQAQQRQPIDQVTGESRTLAGTSWARPNSHYGLGAMPFYKSLWTKDEVRAPLLPTMNDTRTPAKPAAPMPAAGPQTVYWNPLLVTDDKGVATFQFALPPGKENYRVIIEAHGNGRLGRLEQTVTAPPAK